MESLKKFTGIGSKHWEKILLVCVLLGLAGAVVYLMGESQNQKQKINEYFETKRRSNVQPVEEVNLGEHEAALQTLANPPDLNYSTPHNLFNPVKWQKTPEGRMIKIQSGREIGPYALAIEDIRPLKLILALDRSTSSGHWLIMTNEAAPDRRLMRKQDYVIPGRTNIWPISFTEGFRFVITGGRPPEEATEVDMVMVDSGARATVTMTDPYEEVLGYEADLHYPPGLRDQQHFENVRVGDQIRLSSESYNIVAINPDEIILSADSNDRRYSVQQERAQ